MQTRIAALAAVTLLALGFAPPVSAAPVVTAAARYTITDLGTLGSGDSSAAADVNNAGQVVGSFQFSQFETHGFRWVNTVMTDLGTLPGGSVSHANAINDAGQIAGTADRHSGGFGYPVRWSATGA